MRAAAMLTSCIRLIYASGECEIDLVRREVRVLGAPALIGGRAFEIIEVIVQSAGELVTKDELMNRVWPGAVVMENTLHVHVAAVRKALGPYRGLLKTESRRGYRLLGDWASRPRGQANSPTGATRIRAKNERVGTNFPAATAPLIGRSGAQETLRDLVSAYRVVTLTGPGGIGKTTLALEIARQASGDYADGAWLVELAPLSDPSLVPSAVAGVLGLRLGPNISAEAVGHAIAGKNLLLLLDNCEHVIEAAAALVETLIRSCPRMTILATSREVFRIAGECAYRVPPLAVPTDDQVDVEQVLEHSGPQLFITRAKELGADFSPYAESLPTIAAICRRLDGIPLAIEFAAARAATLGIERVAAGLRDRFALLSSGRRASLPRHRTLRAALDWSYDLLTNAERLLLRRLAVFAGGFSLEAAGVVTLQDATSEADIADKITNLVAKSLVASDSPGNRGYFRLLETTRIYALSKLAESGELHELCQRHAEYFRSFLEAIQLEGRKGPIPLAQLDNVRAALEWCFGADGNLSLGIQLAAVAAPMFLAMSLLPECHRWSERGINVLDDTTRGGGEEMHLQASLGAASMHMYGQSDAAREALDRSLVIAQARGDRLHQVKLLSTLAMFHTRGGNFKAALHHAELGRVLAGTTADDTAMALAHSVLGRSLHFMGDHHGARTALEASFQYWSHVPGAGEIHLGLDHHVWVGVGLARTLWLQGYPAQAAERMRETIRDAERSNQPASLDFALFWAPSVFLWVGDLQSAEEHVHRLILHGETHFLGPYPVIGRGFQGALAVLRGDPRGGVESLKTCLDQLRAIQYRMLDTEFSLALAQGLAAIVRWDEAMALIDQTLALIDEKEDFLYMPEALRVKGAVLLSIPRPRINDAEDCLIRSLDWSRRQGARSWELRTAVDLAALWVSHGQRERAQAVLRPIYETFAVGLNTVDLQAAKHLLMTLP
jgi:predicted ATPase/DNA-binding winged helix-turn-helix (wHTH) protein